jgi:hypothetical protein
VKIVRIDVVVPDLMLTLQQLAEPCRYRRVLTYMYMPTFGKTREREQGKGPWGRRSYPHTHPSNALELKFIIILNHVSRIFKTLRLTSRFRKRTVFQPTRLVVNYCTFQLLVLVQKPQTVQIQMEGKETREGALGRREL